MKILSSPKRLDGHGKSCEIEAVLLVHYPLTAKSAKNGRKERKENPNRQKIRDRVSIAFLCG
jgi:hypothetical protein